MTNMRTFCKYAGLLMFFQALIWLAVSGMPPAIRSPVPDFLFETVVFLYYPTVWIVEKFGDFTGESNIIEPVWYGVPLGIFLYSIILASILTFARRGKAKTVTT